MSNKWRLLRSSFYLSNIQIILILQHGLGKLLELVSTYHAQSNPDFSVWRAFLDFSARYVTKKITIWNNKASVGLDHERLLYITLSSFSGQDDGPPINWRESTRIRVTHQTENFWLRYHSPGERCGFPLLYSIDPDMNRPRWSHSALSPLLLLQKSQQSSSKKPMRRRNPLEVSGPMLMAQNQTTLITILQLTAQRITLNQRSGHRNAWNAGMMRTSLDDRRNRRTIAWYAPKSFHNIISW